jgi:predicted acetyltransferase
MVLPWRDTAADCRVAVTAHRRHDAQAMDLRLRRLRPDDEAAFARAHEVMADEDFPFGLGYRRDMPWSEYLMRLDDHEHGRRLPDGWVPSTFRVADVAGVIVGRASIRHMLNPFLERIGGHIGYAVLPEHRRKGYATEILRQSLDVIRALGVDRVLVTCDVTNTASRRTIERCGGIKAETYDGPDVVVPKLRFFIG